MPSSVFAALRWGSAAIMIVLLVLSVLMLQSSATPRASEDAARLVRSAQQPVGVSSLPGMSSEAVAPTPTAVPRIAVDVIGAVQHPGVYWLEPEQRVEDAVKAAGGLAPTANRDGVNMAARVVDGQQIRIPRVDERSAEAELDAGTSPAETGRTGDDLIDINRADAAALDTLPGIGPTTAEAIIDYRTANGPFKTIDAIQDVKGIGPAVFAKIVDKITVGLE